MNDNLFDGHTLISLLSLYVGLQNYEFNKKQDSQHIPQTLNYHSILLNKIIQQNQEILNLLKGDKNDST